MTILECPEDWNGQHVRVEFETTEGTEGHGARRAGAKSVPGIFSSVREGKGFLAALGMTIVRVSRSKTVRLAKSGEQECSPYMGAFSFRF